MSNIGYEIDSSTNLMRLKFKDKLLGEGNAKDHLKEIFEKFILPMLAMNDKFVLTGSLSLKLLGFEPIEAVGDFDFGLSGEFTEDDYNNIKGFFDLHDMAQGYNRDLFPPDITPKYKFNPKAHMWQFSKTWDDEDSKPDNLGLVNQHYFKLDIFNDEIIRKKDIITIYYDNFEVRLLHPSITYSYRMRYALDNRSSTAFKYWERMKSFMDNAKEYYNKIRKIQTMIMRIHEHNVTIDGKKEKIDYIRSLVLSRENNMDAFENLLKTEQNEG